MRHIYTVGGLLLVLFLAGACETPETSSSPSTVTDDLDRTIQLDRPVKRVVSLAPNLTELAYAAGGGSKLVAVTSSDDYPPAVDTLDRLSALPLDFEAVTAQNPDLVLATDQINPPGDTETFDALNLPVYFFSFSSLPDVFEGLRTMGTLLGTQAAAADSARALEQQLEALRARTDSIPSDQRPRVLVLVGDDTLYSFGESSYVHSLVEAAGGRSITKALDASAPTLSEEYVLREKPDVIVGAWGTDYNPDRLLKLHPTWDVVPAVQNDRVYSLPPGLLLRPGPRLIQGAQQLAAFLHPTRFSTIDPALPSPFPESTRTVESAPSPPP
jgi:ABC-type Fe3+-hydroxamate transport system substrate-binding protein